MSLVSINWRPTAKDLRWFGVAILIGFGLIGLLCRYQLFPLHGRYVRASFPPAADGRPPAVEVLDGAGGRLGTAAELGFGVDGAAGRIRGSVPRDVPVGPEGLELRIATDPPIQARVPIRSMAASRRAAYWIWGVAGAVGLLGLTGTALALPFYYAWMGVAFVLGNVMSRLVVTLFFYGMITPMGLLMRATGRDTLRLRKPAGESYWTDAASTPPHRYERQF